MVYNVLFSSLLMVAIGLITEVVRKAEFEECRYCRYSDLQSNKHALRHCRGKDTFKSFTFSCIGR
jgi:hypothetical protein